MRCEQHLHNNNRLRVTQSSVLREFCSEDVSTLSPSSLPHSVSGSLLAVGLPNVLKFSGVETSANGLWSPNGLYLFMQALASPQDSVALTQEDSRAWKKWPCVRVTQHFELTIDSVTGTLCSLLLMMKMCHSSLLSWAVLCSWSTSFLFTLYQRPNYPLASWTHRPALIWK